MFLNLRVVMFSMLPTCQSRCQALSFKPIVKKFHPIAIFASTKLYPDQIECSFFFELARNHYYLDKVLIKRPFFQSIWLQAQFNSKFMQRISHLGSINNRKSISHWQMNIKMFCWHKICRNIYKNRDDKHFWCN